MKLLSIDRNIANNVFTIFVDDGTNYVEMVVDKKANTIVHQYPKGKYESYEHFMGVMGKFDPYTLFLVKPIKIREVTYDNLIDIMEE